jgi:type IV pilus assembly protein PilP
MKRKMKKNKVIVWGVLLILFAAAFGAAGAEIPKAAGQSLPSGTAPGLVPVPMPAAPSVSPAPAQDSSYSYNPLGKPDPFKPFMDVEVKAVKKEKEAQVESIFPLQRADVESFRLVGIIGDEMRRIAIVEDSAKRFYPLFVGTRIGLRNGKVTDILADRLTVDEEDGKKTKRIILKLRKNI